MARIIAGRFQLQDDANHAAEELRLAGFSAGNVSTFFVNPAGHHGTYSIGGDRDVSPGAEEAAPSGRVGALVGGGVGAAIGMVGGPLGAAAGAGVGAYVGSLHGALAGMDKSSPDSTGAAGSPGREIVERPSGMLVAVAVPDDQDRLKAIDLLRRVGASDIEAAEGTITNGDWVDFDPLQPVELIEGMVRTQPAGAAP